MASTLLVVEDSVTMRKVLEITFAGLDFRVVAVPTADAALQKVKAEKTDLVIADVTLDGKNGYELCKALKAASPGTPVLILSSKQAPYDAAKGTDAHADDHMDKPFDTQQMIEKVKKLLESKGVGVAAAPAAAAPKPVAAATPAPVAAAARPAASTPQNAGTPQPAPAAAAAAAQPAQRAKTLIYQPGQSLPGTSGGPVQGPGPNAPAAKPTPQPAPIAAAPAPAPVQRPAGHGTVPSMPAATGGAVAAQVNGQMAAKLEGLGLSPAQADAVMALSRDVIERVVWEVVPVLAETIIKEEIARITK